MSADHGELPLIRMALQLCGRATVRVTGTSMLPTITPGSRVTIERRPFARVRPGEIAAFTLSGGVVVHRVAARDAARLVTAGDNLPLFDPPITADAYLGRVAGPARPPRTAPTAPSGSLRSLAGLTLWCPADPGPVPSLGGLLAAGARLRVAAGPAPGLRAGDGPPGAAGSRRRVPRIGISAAARAGAGTLGALVAAAGGQADVLVGYRFGSSRCGPALLDPDTADHHVRLAAPLEELPLHRALDAVAATLRDTTVPTDTTGARDAAGGPDSRLTIAVGRPL